LVAVSHDQMPSDLHPVRLQIQANIHGVLRRHHARSETNPTRGDASHDRDMFHAPRQSMMNGLEHGGSRDHHRLPLSVFPVGYPDFIKIELNTRWARRPCTTSCMRRTVQSRNTRGT
jgi:hypothetical protein